MMQKCAIIFLSSRDMRQVDEVTILHLLYLNKSIKKYVVPFSGLP